MNVATLSVLVSGAIGLGGLSVPLITEKMSGARRLREAHDARLDELREVVDAAAVALIAVHESEPTLEEVKRGFDVVRAALPRLRTSLFRVQQQEARLAARLGSESDLVRRYDAAQEAVGALHSYWLAVLDGETPSTAFVAANAAIPPAVNAFFATAAATVGPEREPKPR